MSLLLKFFGQGPVSAVAHSSAQAGESAVAARDPSPADQPREGQPAGSEAVAMRHHFGARPLFIAAGRPVARWPVMVAGAAGLLCTAALAALLLLRPVASAAAAPPAEPPDGPPSGAGPATREAAPIVPPPDGQRSRTRDGKRTRMLAKTLEPLPMPGGAELRVTRRVLHPQADDQLALAYGAFLHGNGDAARSGYGQVLAADPENRQALLGLAAVATREGERDEARRLYLQLLDRNPADPLALAGLLAVEEPADLTARESRLKRLLARHPTVAPLHSLLGDLFARQRRWPEARQAYAAALALATGGAVDGTPEVAFNLAIALEHLGQRGEALAHYRTALDGSRQGRPAFDPAVAEARIRALSEL